VYPNLSKLAPRAHSAFCADSVQPLLAFSNLLLSIWGTKNLAPSFAPSFFAARFVQDAALSLEMVMSNTQLFGAKLWRPTKNVGQACSIAVVRKCVGDRNLRQGQPANIGTA